MVRDSSIDKAMAIASNKMFSYKGRLLLNFTLLFLLFSVLIVAFQLYREQSYRSELVETRLRCYADIVSVELQRQGGGYAMLDTCEVMRVIPDDLRLTIVDKQGNVCYESLPIHEDSMANHLARQEVQEAVNNKVGINIRRSATTGLDYFYFAKDYGTYIIRLALPYNQKIVNLLQPDNIFLWFVMLVFPVVLLLLVQISDKFGKSVATLRHFIDSAERGLVDYEHLRFPHTELGDIGQAIIESYQRLNDSKQLVEVQRERLIRHFHYFEEGIAIFSADRVKVYANARFLQYANLLLERPTADIDTIWEHTNFESARNFLLQHSMADISSDASPIYRTTIAAGSTYVAMQVLVYKDGSFEMTLADVTRAEKSRRLKQQMSNSITHELRTPVSSIRGYVETLLNSSTLSEERRRYFLERALAQSIRLSDLIRDVSLITKIEEAPDTMLRETLYPCRVVDEIAEELQAQLQAAQMSLDNQLDAQLCICGNYSLLYSIMRNLIENSIRYAGARTSIRISCYKMAEDYVYFRYYDTGCGVPEEHLPRLFERFYRVGEGRTRDCGGTGLGLSIVRNAVFFHGGDITVRNRKKGGLEFLFTLKR